jgi:hypothetical protein
MHWPIIFGFAGDALTFLGGFLLARDAILKEREFKDLRKLVKAMNILKNVVLTMDDVKLNDEDSANLVFIRQSVKRSKLGTIILTAGFVGLFLSRLCEVMHWGTGAT